MSLNGSETMTGGSIIMPIGIKADATTASMMSIDGASDSTVSSAIS